MSTDTALHSTLGLEFSLECEKISPVQSCFINIPFNKERRDIPDAVQGSMRSSIKFPKFMGCFSVSKTAILDASSHEEAAHK